MHPSSVKQPRTRAAAPDSADVTVFRCMGCRALVSIRMGPPGDRVALLPCLAGCGQRMRLVDGDSPCAPPATHTWYRPEAYERAKVIKRQPATKSYLARGGLLVRILAAAEL